MRNNSQTFKLWFCGKTAMKWNAKILAVVMQSAATQAS